MITILRPKDHEDWLKLRTEGIGSSEVSTILGLNDFSTPRALWLRKMAERKGEIVEEQNEAMLMGHLLEDAVARRWEMATGRTVIKSSADDWIVKNDRAAFMQASPDRTYWTSDARPVNKGFEGKGIVECKTTLMHVDLDDPDDTMARSWFAQLQWQLGVSECKHGSLAVFKLNNREFQYKDYDFDETFFGWMLERVTEFWEKYIIGGEEPESVNAADVMSKYPTHEAGKYAEIEPKYADLIAKRYELKAKIKDYEEQADDIDETIKMLFGDAEALTIDGKVVATWKAPKVSKTFDYKRYAEEHGDDIGDYIVEKQGSRRLIYK